MAAKALQAKLTSPVGVSVNSLPSSFEGFVELPVLGVDGDSYDFDKAVKTNAKSSRLVINAQGKIETEAGPQAFNRKASVMWGTAIEQLQQRLRDGLAAISIDGDKVTMAIKAA